MEIGEVFDEFEGFTFFLENAEGCAARNNEDIEVGETGVGFLHGDLGHDGGSSGSHDASLLAGEGDVEGFGLCGMLEAFLRGLDISPGSEGLWRELFKTSSGPVKSRRLIWSWRVKRTWIGSAASPLSRIALILTVVFCNKVLWMVNRVVEEVWGADRKCGGPAMR